MRLGLALLALTLSTAFAVEPSVHWNTIPHQKVAEQAQVGLIAYHPSGIDRVEFYENNTLLSTIQSPTLNPETSNFEYHCSLDLIAGVQETRTLDAKVYVQGNPIPFSTDSRTVHLNRALTQSQLYTIVVSQSRGSSEGDGSENSPFATIDQAITHLLVQEGTVSGYTIQVESGLYTTPDLNDLQAQTFLTIEAKENHIVTLEGFTRPRIPFLHFKDLTFTHPSGNDPIMMGSYSDDYILWLDHCTVVGRGEEQHTQGSFVSWDLYLSDCTWSNSAFGPRKAKLVRNSNFSQIGQGVFENVNVILNCDVQQINTQQLNSSYLYRIFHPEDSSFLIDSLRATDINAYGLDIAETNNLVSQLCMVNSIIHQGQALSHYKSQVLSPIETLSFIHNSFIDQNIFFRTDECQEIHLINNFFDHINHYDINEAILLASMDPFSNNNHYRSSNGFNVIAPGTNTSNGNPQFIDEENLDFQPLCGSILGVRVHETLIVHDQTQSLRRYPSSLGAIEKELGPKAIAHWNVVPHREFQSSFQVGIVAFHKIGISEVEFTTEGGSVSLAKASINPRTQTWEYWITLDPNNFQDGPITLQAKATPIDGEERVLEDLVLFSNAQNSLMTHELYVSTLGDDLNGTGSSAQPYQTLNRAFESANDLSSGQGGVKILLDSGIYNVPNQAINPARSRYIEICPQSGLSSADVQITGTGIIHSKDPMYLHINNIELLAHGAGTHLIITNSEDKYLWMEDCKITGLGLSTKTSISYGYQQYLIGSTLENNKIGATKSHLIRNVQVENVRSDAFSHSTIVLNSKVKNLNPLNNNNSAVIYKTYSTNQSVDNRILFGVEATECNAKAFSFEGVPEGETINNIALVNVLFENTSHVAFKSEIKEGFNHLYMNHVTLPNQDLLFRHGNMRHVYFSNSIFTSLTYLTEDVSHKVLGHNNHVIDSTGYHRFVPGYNYTVGEAYFEDPEQHDYRPSSASPCQNRITTPSVDIDLAFNPVPVGGSIGALQP